MTKKKFLLILFVPALLAGIVAFNACKKDNPADNPADEGKKAAQELCNCLNNAQNEQAEASCFSDFEIKKGKFKDAKDAKTFEDAFNQEIGECNSYLTYLAAQALQELCSGFAANKGDMEAEQAVMYGLMNSIYGAYMENQVFRDAFEIAFYNCGYVPTWSILWWSDAIDLLESVTNAAQELCDCFTSAADDVQAQGACAELFFSQNGSNMQNQAFVYGFLNELGLCNSVPVWFWEQITGGGSK